MPAALDRPRRYGWRLPTTVRDRPMREERSSSDVNIDLDLGSLAEDANPTATGEERKPSKSIVIFLLLTVLAVAPSLLICMTSFTRIVIRSEDVKAVVQEQGAALDTFMKAANVPCWLPDPVGTAACAVK